MTPEQIQNWRTFLAGTEIGPYAFIMPSEDIERFRDLFQAKVDSLSESKPKPVIDADGRCQHKVAAKHCKICGTKPKSKRRF